ncbi:MAG: hypothetical protein EB070_03895 [Synechococcaceae bacterium WBA_2_066]|nr:hypothetical protein [Synechococcaceae bacterium WB6_1A_059]NBP32235.1 hypothetical protein [Synechococcaceae bacterium WB6_1B_055]NBP99198.1 hypothetical protein [Synechococcaceae bacterium WB6_3A_227]NBQ18701.1 hypothetical protein [Synechococcaceae bacterium WB5_2A_257]NBR43887.1 hypothetical protein [Synechococcaceae bacterium WB5_2B_268]NBY58954.1 hypothetical protein [Synechococcaceae bacterium LLD_019]NCU77118.1 hypothetical protein [Synechococcaceae bacterium WB7_1C_051]NCU91182.1
MVPAASTLNPDQLEQLELFLKDWLRHSGRTQADLRRSLRAGSIRMPALLQELQRTVMQAGVVGLAERLCSIEAEWQHHSPPVVGEELAQLDLLLQSIRNDAS